MSEPEFRTTFSAAWVGDGTVPLPARSVAMMAAEDVQASRQASEDAARAQDRADAMWQSARTWGDVKQGLAGVFTAAERRMSAQDYSEAQAELRRSATDWTGEEPRRRREWSDTELGRAATDAAVRVLGRQVDEDRLAERVASEKLIAQARERHPETSSWPAWTRPRP